MPASPSNQTVIIMKTRILSCFLSALFTLLLLGSGTAYGQDVQLAALDQTVFDVSAAAADAEPAVPVYYGMPTLRKRLPEFSYPIRAEKFQVEGTVVVQFTLNENGRVRQAEILKSVPHGCDEEVLRVLRQARFEPVQAADDPSATARYVAAFEFRLDG